MSTIAIRAENVSKAYRLGVRENRAETLVEAMGAVVKAPWRNFQRLRRLDTSASAGDAPDVLWALREVSFEICQGEIVGFVGRNGAGKSTLLKILSRITDPTGGRITVRGRLSSLLEVGTGFHPELTGRENVYMNGTILGMRRREIDRKFDEIVAFSGVERFLDTPIKRYSSGMKVRLAFSVAAHLEPDVLIVDEVLAVGDAEFQRKCLGKMQDVAGHGRTVLFVSHNMGAVQTLCSRAIALRDGRLIEDGPAAAVVRSYLASLNRREESGFAPGNPHRRTRGDLVLTGGRVLNGNGEPSTELTAGEAMTLEFSYANPAGHLSIEPTVIVRNGDDVPVLHLQPGYSGARIIAQRAGTLRCTLPRLPLALGDYRVDVKVTAGRGLVDHIPNALFFAVQASSFYPTGLSNQSKQGAVLADQDWGAASSFPAPPVLPRKTVEATVKPPARDRVAVVIPFYQRTPGPLGRALESCFAQTVPPARIVVVDDGAPVDPESEIAALPPAARSCIDIVRRPNGGPGAARNTGLDYLRTWTGRIAFLDSDDTWVPEHLFRAGRVLDNGFTAVTADWIPIGGEASAYAAYGLFDPQAHRRLSLPWPAFAFTGDLVMQQLRAPLGRLSTLVLDGAKHGQLRFDPRLRHSGEDRRFFIDLARDGVALAVIAAPGCRSGRGINIFARVAWGSGAMLDIELDRLRLAASLRRELSAPDHRRALDSFSNETIDRFWRGWLHGSVRGRLELARLSRCAALDIAAIRRLPGVVRQTIHDRGAAVMAPEAAPLQIGTPRST
jgi:lipopolysaccharide transport system ATP-binding protein